MEHQRIGDPTPLGVRSPCNHLSLVETVDALRAQLKHLVMQIRGGEAATEVTPQKVRSILGARIQRGEFLRAGLFADPAWDMLLELFARELEYQRVSVSELCRASRVPETTGVRWINNLEKEELVTRRDDPFDRRRVWVTLSSKGSAAMQGYFEALLVCLLPR